MPRARILKPGFFTNEHLARFPLPVRVLFQGLWLLADREGRLEDRPERIKAEIFPFDADLSLDMVGSYLDMLGHGRFIVRYGARVHGVWKRYISIPQFVYHQHPHPHEPVSRIPPPPSRSRLSDRRQGNVTAMSLHQPDIAVTKTADSDSDSDSEYTYYSAVAETAPAPPPAARPDPTKFLTLSADPSHDQNLRVITKLVHVVLDLGVTPDDLPDAVKAQCAEQHIAYNATLVHQAIDSARAQRRRSES